MIDKNSALYSVPLALLGASKGLVVSPIQGTPLAELVKITNDMLMASPKCFSESDTIADSLNSLAEDLGYCTVINAGSSAHDLLMDSYIIDISKAVANHISFAKNVVKPVIVSMVEDVQKVIGEVESPSAAFKIEIVDLPKPMQNAGFETSIAKFAEQPYIAPTNELRLGEISPQGILDLMKTGSKEYDERISEWFVNKGDMFFMDIWNNLFRDFKEGKPSIVFKFDEVLVKGDVADYALAIHLLSRKLYDEVPENTGMTLFAFRDLVSQFRSASGIKLNLEYLRYASILKNKSLVSYISADSKTCKVNGAVYRDWLKDGGSNEVLLGMLVGTKSLYMQSVINENKEKFISDWNSYSLFNTTAQKNKSFNRIKNILTLSFAKLLSDMSTEEKEIVATKNGYIEKVNQIFIDELSNLKTSDTNDIFDLCLKLVCRARFFYTDSEKILVGINEAVKANANIDIREAALLSTIEYIVDYVSNQLKITSI